jgi:hypothetical protein
VAGLVLLNPLHEDWNDYMPEHLKIAANMPADAPTPDLPQEFLDQLRAMLLDTMAGSPSRSPRRSWPSTAAPSACRRAFVRA